MPNQLNALLPVTAGSSEFSPLAVTAIRQSRVDQCVERLCYEGCRKVREYIRALQSGEQLPALAHLKPLEVNAVLGELKSIMAAYNGSCRA